MNNYLGKCVSAKYSPYYTEKYGEPDRNILGYSLHILITHQNGKKLDNVMCLELPVYATECSKVNEKIRFLQLVDPIFCNILNDGSMIPIWDGKLKIESYLNLGIRSKGELKVKEKNGKVYKMGDNITPHCVLKKPLLTGTYLDENVQVIKPVAIKSIPVDIILNSENGGSQIPVRPLPQLLPLPA
jgi:hypothetical protein